MAKISSNFLIPPSSPPMCVYVVLSAWGAARNSSRRGGGGAYCQGGEQVEEGGEGGLGLCISVCVCHQFEHVTLHDADTQNETNTTNINDIYLSVLIVSGWVSLFSLFVSIRGVIIGMGVKDRVLTCLF